MLGINENCGILLNFNIKTMAAFDSDEIKQYRNIFTTEANCVIFDLQPNEIISSVLIQRTDFANLKSCMLKRIFTELLLIHHLKALACSSGFVLLSLTLSVPNSSYGALNPFLATNGRDIRNNFGQGDSIPLRGVNLGSWLLMEGWMCPMDSSGLADNYSVIQTLNSRFGVATQESLIKTYQEAWLTTNDLDNIKALGMNCVRVPFWWGNVERLDGSWRADAFEKMDWLVTNAWRRGVYTIIDFHGVPGGQSTSDSTAQANQNQYWTNPAFQTQTAFIWSNVAAHFAGNPAVAGYDLINEPFGAPSQAALWNAYSNLYRTVRSVDPNHIIFIEGCWSGSGLNWEWNVLPPPGQFGWTNVVYSMHAYAGDTSPGGEKTETDKQVNDFKNHLAWNVPCFIGEFNSHGTETAWQYSILQYDQNNMNWANWAYKAIAGSVGNSWGIYDPTGTWPSKPNIQTDSAAGISNKWSQWKTSAAFGITSYLKQYLGAPWGVEDIYTNNGGDIITVPAASGVLANDHDINLDASGISLSAILAGNPTNGQLVLNSDGSFSYTPNTGFSGTDTFEYRIFDGYVDSANVVPVSVQVVSNVVVGPVAQLIWSTQPTSATNGLPFGQQPALMTADNLGHPSTNGLPALVPVTVVLSAGTGPLLGLTHFNIGTAGSNGVVRFENLQINSAGENDELTALVASSTPASLLTNGNFNTPGSTNTPTGWTTWTFEGGYADHELLTSTQLIDMEHGTVYPDNTGIYDGTYQMTCGCNGTSGGGGVYQIVAVTPGMEYTLSVESGAEGWWLPLGQIRLFFLDADDNQLGLIQINTTDDIHSPDQYDIGVPYQNWSLSAVAPAEATQVKVEFAGYGGGSVWFDNAVLIESNSIPSFTPATTLPFTVYSPVSQTNAVLGVINNNNGTFSLNFAGTVGAVYYVQSTTNLMPPVNWQPVAGSTNTVTNSDGIWSFTSSNTDPQRYYRSVVTSP